MKDESQAALQAAIASCQDEGNTLATGVLKVCFDRLAGSPLSEAHEKQILAVSGCLSALAPTLEGYLLKAAVIALAAGSFDGPSDTRSQWEHATVLLQVTAKQYAAAKEEAQEGEEVMVLVDQDGVPGMGTPQEFIDAAGNVMERRVTQIVRKPKGPPN